MLLLHIPEKAPEQIFQPKKSFSVSSLLSTTSDYSNLHFGRDQSESSVETSALSTPTISSLKPASASLQKAISNEQHEEACQSILSVGLNSRFFLFPYHNFSVII